MTKKERPTTKGNAAHKKRLSITSFHARGYCIDLMLCKRIVSEFRKLSREYKLQQILSLTCTLTMKIRDQ